MEAVQLFQYQGYHYRTITSPDTTIKLEIWCTACKKYQFFPTHTWNNCDQLREELRARFPSSRIESVSNYSIEHHEATRNYIHNAITRHHQNASSPVEEVLYQNSHTIQENHISSSDEVYYFNETPHRSRSPSQPPTPNTYSPYRNQTISPYHWSYHSSPSSSPIRYPL